MIFIIKNDNIIANRVISFDNVYVSYPFFDDGEIDKYIFDYLNGYEDYDEVFIDYDYLRNDNYYYITFTKRLSYDNIILIDTNLFIIDVSKHSVILYTE